MRALVCVMVLAGCAIEPAAETTCNAANYREFVGQPETAVYGVLPNLRVVRPDEVVTDDYNPDRLNAEVGSDGLITRFACY